MAHPVPVVCADWTTGTGYSPPARNEAVSPESAISSGSANWRTNPLVSRALKTTSRLAPLLARLAIATPKGCAPESNVPAVVNIGRPGAPLPAGDPTAGTGFPLASTVPVIPGRPPGAAEPIPVVKP